MSTTERSQISLQSLSNKEWDDLRDHVIALYQDYNRTLSEVAEQLTHETGCFINERMVRTRISRWSAHKNFKAADMLAALRLIRDSVTSQDGAAFVTFRGRVLTTNMIEHYFRKKTGSGTELQTPTEKEAPIPSGMRVAFFAEPSLQKGHDNRTYQVSSPRSPAGQGVSMDDPIDLTKTEYLPTRSAKPMQASAGSQGLAKSCEGVMLPKLRSSATANHSALDTHEGTPSGEVCRHLGDCQPAHAAAPDHQAEMDSELALSIFGTGHASAAQKDFTTDYAVSHRSAPEAYPFDMNGQFTANSVRLSQEGLWPTVGAEFDNLQDSHFEDLPQNLDWHPSAYETSFGRSLGHHDEPQLWIDGDADWTRGAEISSRSTAGGP